MEHSTWLVSVVQSSKWLKVYVYIFHMNEVCPYIWEMFLCQ
jgi:hypothetical protein